MTGSEFLTALLASQRLADGSPELVALDKVRDEVERLIKSAYPYSIIHFTHGGSRAKGTMVREDYDLDLVVYFENEDDAPGETLEEIYENIAALLDASFTVRRKRSALRLRAKKGGDLRVDVVPGRYIDATRTDAFIHQNEGSKERQKTNLEVHIRHVGQSRHTSEIALSKIWRTRHNVGIKTFPLELLVINVLDEDGSGDIEVRFRRVLDAFADRIDELQIEDPANPYGNDLSHALTNAIRREVAKAAIDTCDAVDTYGWAHAFGESGYKQAVPNVNVIRSAAAAVATPTRPWSMVDDELE
jgi:Nucleotidyltransferase domain